MTKTRHPLAAALALALAATTLPAHAYDLLQAFRDAQANDAVLASARAQLVAAREAIPQAQAGLRPGLNGTFDLSRQQIDIAGPAPTRFSSPRTYGVNLSVPIFRPQNLEAFEQSRLQVAQAEATFANARQDLAVRVAQAYFDVLAAQDALTTIRAQKRAIAEQLESARRSFEVGTATITDQQEAQARFDLATAQEAAAENDIEVRRSALQLLVGRQVGTLFGLRRDVALTPPSPAAESEWVSTARNGNFTVQQAQAGSEIARREIQRQRYGHYPTLDLVGRAARAEGSVFAGNPLPATTTTAIGISLAVPIYQGGVVDSRVRQASANYDRALADLENTRRQAEQTARQAFLGVTSGLAQVRALEAAERSSRLALDSNLLGYQVGVRINVDVLNAQQQLFTTQRDLARARYDAVLGSLRLQAAAAVLDEEDVAQVNALLGEPQPEPELNITTTPVPARGAGPDGSATSGAGGAPTTAPAPGEVTPPLPGSGAGGVAPLQDQRRGGDSGRGARRR